MVSKSAAYNPIRVLYLIDSVGPHAGTENQLVQLIANLDRKRVQPFLCCLEPSKRLEMMAREMDTEVFPVVRLYSPEGIRQLLKLAGFIRRNRIQIVHAFMPKSSTAGVIAAQFAGRPPVLTTRRSIGYWYTPRLLRLMRLLNRFTSCVLTNCEAARQVTIQAERISPERVKVFYNGVEIEKFRNGSAEAARMIGVPADVPVVGIVANYRPVKDLGLFLRAAAIISREAPPATFLLVGTGPQYAELRALADSLGIGERVFFTQGQGAVPDCLAAMSIACLSSSSEAFSNAILEYMACGLPVVATRVGGLPEAIEEGVTGFLVDSREPEAFAAPVIRLLQDAELRRRMGEAGYERCQRMFSLSGAIREQEDFYEQLLSNAAAPAS